jgi:methyl-accepting chemotaxis protein
LKLLAKLNLLLLVVFGFGLLVTWYAAKGFLQNQAQAEVLREAGLMAAAASATRDYTEHQVSPILEKTAQHQQTFLQQTIPFFAATSTFEGVRKSYPDYTYKEAALNPTNLRDRATDWEADLINHFRNSPTETELVRIHEGATGTSLYLAHPIRVEAGCLQCHSQPSVAPRAMLTHYGNQHGFGWTNGEIVGAQIIAVPTSVTDAIAERGLRELMIDISATFLAALCLLDFGLYVLVVKPLRLISENADRVSQGDLDVVQVEPRGNDEVAQVTRSINSMHTSLKKAVDLLNG